MACLRKVLPLEVQELVQAYASDKVGVHPTATLIKSLRFRPNFPDPECLENFPSCSMLASTLVQCPLGAGRFTHPNLRFYNTDRYLRFIHREFDERNFPQRFDISLRWDNMRQQDEIEAMGAEDVRH